MSIVFSIVGGKPQYNHIPTKIEKSINIKKDLPQPQYTVDPPPSSPPISPIIVQHKPVRYNLPKGVSFHVGGKKYVARVYRQGIQVWLGSFKTVTEAVDAVATANKLSFNWTPAAELDHSEISARAYQIWLNRGCIDGYAEEDWKEAKRQLIAEKR